MASLSFAGSQSLKGKAPELTGEFSWVASILLRPQIGKKQTILEIGTSSSAAVECFIDGEGALVLSLFGDGVRIEPSYRDLYADKWIMLGLYYAISEGRALLELEIDNQTNVSARRDVPLTSGDYEMSIGDGLRGGTGTIMEISEVFQTTKVLTSSERAATLRYLKEKWDKGDAPAPPGGALH